MIRLLNLSEIATCVDMSARLDTIDKLIDILKNEITNIREVYGDESVMGLVAQLALIQITAESYRAELEESGLPCGAELLECISESDTTLSIRVD